MEPGQQPDLAQLEQLTSTPNWDDEQGEAIPTAEWDSARGFLNEIYKRQLLPVVVSPCGDGSIHFAWQVGEIEIVRAVVERKGARQILSLRAKHMALSKRLRLELAEAEALSLIGSLLDGTCVFSGDDDFDPVLTPAELRDRLRLAE